MAYYRKRGHPLPCFPSYCFNSILCGIVNLGNLKHALNCRPAALIDVDKTNVPEVTLVSKI